MYRFLANSMLIFVVNLTSGLIKNVEFESCSPGVYSFMTDNKEVAEAIRRHPLTRKGLITDVSEPSEQTDKVEAPGKEVKDENVLHFDNITKAKTYLQKTFKVEVRKLKSPDSVKEKAKELGVLIDF